MSTATERANARRRHRENLRRTTISDITPEQELEMRRRARKCPMPGCGVWMTDKPNRPNSKHLDHIVPLNQLGTHTHGNVRIICALCNLRRPKDGSDYTGPVTLWAQADGLISRPDRRRTRAHDRITCGNGLHPWVPENIRTYSDGKRRCQPCQREAWQKRKAIPQRCRCGAPFTAKGNTFMCTACIDAAGRRAAELHASGLSWKQVAAEVGYTTDEGARYAAQRIGYQPPPRERRVPQRRVCPDCGGPKGEGSRICTPCTTAKAWQAVALRLEGRTLRYIADHMGYNSVTSVTNLMKTVTVIDSRIGRPSDAPSDLQKCPAA